MDSLYTAESGTPGGPFGPLAVASRREELSDDFDDVLEGEDYAELVPLDADKIVSDKLMTPEVQTLLIQIATGFALKDFASVRKYARKHDIRTDDIQTIENHLTQNSTSDDTFQTVEGLINGIVNDVVQHIYDNLSSNDDDA